MGLTLVSQGAQPRDVNRGRLRRSFLIRIAPALPAIVFLLLVLIIPLSALFLRSVTDPVIGLGNYEKLLADETYSKVLLNTFWVSIVVTAASLVVGFPVGWLLAMLPRHRARWLFAFVLLSMWTNLLARTYGWMVLLQGTGIINRLLMKLGIIDTPLELIGNLTGVTIGMTHIMLPFAILPIYTNLSNVDPAIMQAASISGARSHQVFCRILLPLSAPGIGTAGMMIFVMSLGYFITPALLGGTSNMMLAELIAQLVQSLLNWGLGSAAAFILLVVTLCLFAIFIKMIGLDRKR